MVDIRTVGVIGAGQMGAGIAHVSALAGYEVVVNDVTGVQTCALPISVLSSTSPE